MFCEHPACRSEATSLCQNHCHLSVCQTHRLEHEKSLLHDFETHLNQLKEPVTHLLTRSREDVKRSEELRQEELRRINILFDQYFSSINQRLKSTEEVQHFLPIQREHVTRCQNGDYQLTKEDHRQLQNLSQRIEKNLHEQTQCTRQLRDRMRTLEPCSITQDINESINSEFIELSDSEDNRSQPSIESMSVDQPSEHESSIDQPREPLSQLKQANSTRLARLRGSCPLTKMGIFGLKSSHHLPHLCLPNNKERCLLNHFIRNHRIKSSISYQLVKAITAGCDPMTTKIFPQDDTPIIIENIMCPFHGKTLKKLPLYTFIPSTPCYSDTTDQHFRTHLTGVHSISKQNAELIYHAMKTVGTIDHLRWETDLCDD